jgi:glycosyltransferase 2 family protein
VSTKQRLTRILRPPLTIAAVAFVVYAARDLALRWESSQVTIAWPLLLASLVPAALSVPVLAFGWKWLLERMTGTRLPRVATLAVNLESQIARYMPGKVGLLLMRMTGAERIGAPPSAIASSVVIEVLSYVAVGGACAFLALYRSTARFGALELLGRWGLLGLALVAVATLIALSVDRRVLPKTLLSWLALEGKGAIAPLRLPLSHVFYWLLWMAHGYLVTRAVGGSSAASLSGAGLYVLASIMGFLALVVPGGLGVREAFISVGLAPLVGPAPAVAAAIASRAASVLVDVAGWLVARPFAGERPAAVVREP